MLIVTTANAGTISIHRFKKPKVTSTPVVQIVPVRPAAPRMNRRRGGGGSGGGTTSQSTGDSSDSEGFQTPTITFANVTKSFGDSSFTLSPSSDSPGPFTFISENTSVATISGKTVTIVGGGTAVITAIQSDQANYTRAGASMTLTVNPIAPTIGTFSNVSKVLGEISYIITNPTSNSSGAFSYTSSNPLVATVSGNIVFLHAAGTTTITATQAATANYTSGVKTATLTVIDLSEA
jgi:hypothetical protein